MSIPKSSSFQARLSLQGQKSPKGLKGFFSLSCLLTLAALLQETKKIESQVILTPDYSVSAKRLSELSVSVYADINS